MARLISGSRGRGICHLPVASSCPRTLAPVKSPRACPDSPGGPQVQPAGQGPGAGSEGPGAGVPWPPRPPLPRARSPHRPARLFGEESGPICFHSESLKIPFWRNEKRKARFPRLARWVPARARRRAGGRPSPSPPPPLPSARLPPPPTRAVAPGPRAAGLQAPGGQAELICMKPTLAAHLQRRN